MQTGKRLAMPFIAALIAVFCAWSIDSRAEPAYANGEITKAECERLAQIFNKTSKSRMPGWISWLDGPVGMKDGVPTGGCVLVKKGKVSRPPLIWSSPRWQEILWCYPPRDSNDIKTKELAPQAGVQSDEPQREADRIAAEQREAERIAAEQREAERKAAERREAERKAAEQQAAEQREAERIAAEQKAAEQREAERIAAEQKAAEQREAERIAAEQKAAEQREVERKAAEQQAAEQREAERIAAEQKAAEQREVERKAAEQQAAEQREAERIAAEQQAAEQREAERIAAEQQAAEQREAERKAAEQQAAEAEQKAAEQKAARSPQKISVISQEDGTVTISWDGASVADDGTYYRIRRRSDVGGKFRVIVRKIQDDSSIDSDDSSGHVTFTDDLSGVDSSAQYLFYSVRAFHSDGSKSKWSSALMVGCDLSQSEKE